MSQTLIRRCDKVYIDLRKCSTTMIVEVDTAVISIAAGQKPKVLGYKNVECKSGCTLGFRVTGQGFSRRVANKEFFKAVYCSKCYAVKYLKVFEEVKL